MSRRGAWLALALAGCATAGTRAADVAAIERADAAFDADTAARGIDGWLAWFEDGTTSWDKHEVVHGKQHYRESLGRLLGDPRNKLRWQPAWAEVSSDLGYTTGRWQLHRAGDDGVDRVVGTGKYVTVWRRQPDGRWKAVFDLGNDDAPPPAVAAVAAPPAHWSYEGESGPARWGALDAAFAACAAGQRQSPIALASADAAPGAPPLAFHYRAGGGTLANNGHTVQATPSAGGALEADGASWPLVQVHFHHPSEHTLDGKRFPLEVHFVHRGAAGLAVVGVLVDEGAANPALAALWAKLPAKAGESVPLPPDFDPAALLPVERGYLGYTGSLTTPPCSEGVAWRLLRAPITASRAQLDAFAALFPGNSRPLQPRNARPITAR